MTATGNPSPAIRLTEKYRILWQGRVIKEGHEVLRLVHIGKLVQPTYMTPRFKPPKEPLMRKRLPILSR